MSAQALGGRFLMAGGGGAARVSDLGYGWRRQANGVAD